MSDPVRLLGLSGSLRRASSNTAILRSLSELVGERIELALFPLHHVPLYSGDLEQDLPAAVAALKHAVSASDGLILCSPEYNHGMSGVLKNAIDWVSRPAFASPLCGKPTLLMSATDGFVGGARCQAHMLDAMTSALARVIARPQVVIGGVGQKLQDGRLVDRRTIEFCLAAIDDLVQEIGWLHARPLTRA